MADQTKEECQLDGRCEDAFCLDCYSARRYGTVEAERMAPERRAEREERRRSEGERAKASADGPAPLGAEAKAGAK